MAAAAWRAPAKTPAMLLGEVSRRHRMQPAPRISREYGTRSLVARRLGRATARLGAKPHNGDINPLLGIWWRVPPRSAKDRSADCASGRHDSRTDRISLCAGSGLCGRGPAGERLPTGDPAAGKLP